MPQLAKAILWNPRFGDHFSHYEELNGKLLRVLSVEHGIQTLKDVHVHYVSVYTELVEDSALSRVTGG